MERRLSGSTEDQIYSILKDSFSSESKPLIDIYGTIFIRQLLNSTRYNSSLSNIIMQEPPCFKGYPSGNYLKQVAKVLEI